MKPRAHLKLRDAPVHVHRVCCRIGDAREELEQRAFARAVAPENARDLAALHLERHFLERLKRVAVAGVSVAVGPM